MTLTKKDTGHFFAVGGILCGVSALAALLIGLANMVTAPVIAENQAKATQAALAYCFEGDADVFGDPVEVSDHTYVYEYRVSYASDAKTDIYGYIFSGKGSNTYGKVDIMVGLRYDSTGEVSYGRIGIIENTESYKTILEGKYIDVYNANPGVDALNEVSCGATRGANLVRNIVNDAVSLFGTIDGEGA